MTAADAHPVPAPDPMKVLDDSAAAVATFTGIKSLYVAAGWHERNAERMVIQTLALAVSAATGK